ncbi:MAG: metallopeptidase TldD-related protein [Acidobacteriota bacterium]
MPFAHLDCAAVGRSLTQLSTRPEDLADAYFERTETLELPGSGATPGVRVRREEGFALRLTRERQTWLASRDGFDSKDFGQALRQVARVYPSAAYPAPRLEVGPWDGPPAAPELTELTSALERSIRAHHVAFPLMLTARRHRRWLRVVSGPLVTEPEQEGFYSCTVELPWGTHGALFPKLGPPAVAHLADHLVETFRARRAPPPEPFRGVVVLGPGATAVLLHEAIAHSLEADLLALSGHPEGAVGVRLGRRELSVLDDPATAPEEVRRRTDDEGRTVRRRWLLREGVVQQPLADAAWAEGSEILIPGAARRGDRHGPPDPRSSHLELLAGDTAEDDLRAEAEGGLWIAEASRGSLDPLTGVFELGFVAARRIRGGAIGEPVGAGLLSGRIADLLGSLTAVGDERRLAGAGWCAKGGRKVPVWATCPAVRLEGLAVTPW